VPDLHVRLALCPVNTFIRVRVSCHSPRASRRIPAL
jgi:hypothetical protein